MKWSKPSHLEAYGVQLVGWPSDISYKNPSAMSIKETRRILELLKSRQLYFQYLTHRQNIKYAPGTASIHGTNADYSATDSDPISNPEVANLIDDTPEYLTLHDSLGSPSSKNRPVAKGEQESLSDLSIRASISPDHTELSSIHSDQQPRRFKRSREGPA